MFRIHWKGCPHRRLPRIRLPPVRSSASRANLAQDASEAVHLLPFSSALKKAREKERMRARKRRSRSRSSRSHSDQTNISLKAIRDIEVFGWDSTRHLDSLGGENKKIGSKEEGFLDLTKNYQIVESVPRFRNGLAEYSGNHPRTRMDGASSSKAPSNSANANIPRERRFTPTHWNKPAKPGLDNLHSGEPSRATTFGRTRISGAYLPCFSSTDPTQTAPTPAVLKRTGTVRISNKRVPTKGVSITNAPSRSRTYDPRFPTKKVVVKEDRQRVTKSSPASSKSPDLARGVSVASKAVSRNSKRRGWTSPEFRNALNSIVNQRRESDKGPKELVSDIDVTEPSRTSGEQRALDKFTLELAKSLADPKKIRRPIESSTVPSIHTIDDLQPYAPEFRAAGLSVTFQDQVLTSPRFRQIQTPARGKPQDIAYTLRTFSFERKRTRPADGPADMQKIPAKAPVWNSETPTDDESSAGSTFTEGHHHVRRIKANPNQGAPSQLPPAPPRPIPKTKSRIQVDSKTERKAAPSKAPAFNSPSDFTSSGASMSWTEGHHHVRAIKNSQPKSVVKEVKYAETTPTPAPRKAASTRAMHPAQPPKKSIPWLQTGERSPRTRTEGPTVWQENVFSEPQTSSESSFITVIDWSPIEDPRANLDVFPLVARPSEVEWVEMNYEQGRQSAADPTVRVVDMKKKDVWEEADPRSTVDIVPIEKSAMIVPVNVISITPVSSVYSFNSSKRANPQIPNKPLLCTQCGRLLASPPTVLPPPPTNSHKCRRNSSLCEECAPYRLEKSPSPKPASPRLNLPSPTGSPPPPIVPVRSIRRTGIMFPKSPVSASLSMDTDGSLLGVPRFREITDDSEINNDALQDKIVEVISQTKVNSPKLTSSAPMAISSRGSVDTIVDIISHYSPLESVSKTTTPIITSETTDPKRLRDKDIFRGLQVVTLAACDRDVDTWIQDMSGPGIRKFLADVGGFEKMGIGELSRQARKTARKRRREFEEALKEKETAQTQNDGVGEASDGSGSSTVKAWKAVETGDNSREDNQDSEVGFAADDEPVCHVSGSGMEMSRNLIGHQQMNEEKQREEHDERGIEKGKGREKEREPKFQGNVRSRRDRFGFRDGNLR